jgi:hypothetical protein
MIMKVKIIINDFYNINLFPKYRFLISLTLKIKFSNFFIKIILYFNYLNHEINKHKNF